MDTLEVAVLDTGEQYRASLVVSDARLRQCVEWGLKAHFPD